AGGRAGGPVPRPEGPRGLLRAGGQGPGGHGARAVPPVRVAPPVPAAQPAQPGARRVRGAGARAVPGRAGVRGRARGAGGGLGARARRGRGAGGRVAGAGGGGPRAGRPRRGYIGPWMRLPEADDRAPAQVTVDDVDARSLYRKTKYV